MLQLKKGSLFGLKNRIRLQQATTFWFFRLIAGATLAGVVVIPILRLMMSDLPMAVWSIEGVLLVALVFVYLVTLVNGKWDEKNHRLQVDPLVTLMMISVVIAGLIAFCQDVLSDDGVMTYATYVVIAVLVLLSVLITSIIEKKLV